MPAGIYLFPLSLELMRNVAEYLDTEDLQNLRLSSRYLRDGSLYTFARRRFRHRRHVVNLESLECLPAISRHAEFGHAIRTVEISDVVVKFKPQGHRRPSLTEISSTSLG